MHLRAIKLRGFKSFPEPTEVRLEPGVAVVVGPNGSGKSNVSDAIVWAAGSQSPSELRAERADDVLFGGAASRPAAAFCEVELLFDNADGGFAELDFAEVSIARRLHRGGEGQYLVNGAGVRRLDVVELLADVGLGGGLGSVIGQGRVEAVLAGKPEDLRALVEEAAGLGRFKRRRHRAGLKLARVAAQAERARDVEAEVAKRLRPLALQATAAERAERLGGEIAGLRAAVATVDLAEIEARADAARERQAAAALERGRIERRLEALLRERAGVEDELADAAGRREAATAALYRHRSASERLALRLETVLALRDRLCGELAEAVELSEAAPGTGAELERAAAEAAGAARTLAGERDLLAERAALARARLEALDRGLAEREGLPPAARALAEAGQELVLTLLEVEPGYERAVAAALAWRGAAVLAPDVAAGLKLIERTRAEGLGSVGVVVAGGRRGDELPPPPGAGALRERVRERPGGEAAAALLDDVRVVGLGELTGTGSGLAVTLEGHCYDARAGELRFAGETAESVLLELAARRRALAAEADELGRSAELAAASAAAAAEAAARAEAALGRVGSARGRTVLDPERLRRPAQLAERLAAALEHAAGRSARFEAPLRARVDAGSGRAAELGARLRTLGAGEAGTRREAAEAAERAGAVEIELARLAAEADEAGRRLAAAGATPAEGSDPEALAARLERLERRRESLGGVNPLAKEEYEREKERLAELSEQREDLERSLAELDRLRADLVETVERRFAETFQAVAAHFEEVSATLFPGGHGRLRLTEPEPDEGEEAGSPGIEVELRPAGKRVTRLSLLSGGEKALGAIAFLFSLFLARPSPFYLLDEVEAALDDANIGRFVELLRRYADRAQFIVITHQKRTMEAADILYGVTMAADGVSQIVSRRLPEAGRALAATGA
ncbi:MAG: chromosome segregation SMC family protein [Gaiellaceae bacterium]